MANWKEWFESAHAHRVCIENDSGHYFCDLEDLYQVFKARIIEEQSTQEFIDGIPYDFTEGLR